MFFTAIARFIHSRTLHRPPPGTTPLGNPLPRQVHQVLGERATRHRRVILVGDVHGCVEELRLLLDKCYYRPGVDLLISVGDLVNKGPSSAAVLQLVLDCGALTVRGNHDEEALAAHADALAGRPLGKSVYEWVRGVEEPLLGVMRQMPFSLRLEAYNVGVVHAGLVPGRGLEQQSWRDLITMRDLVPTAILQSVPEPTDSESEAGGALPEGAPPTPVLPAYDWEGVSKEAEAVGLAGSATTLEPGALSAGLDATAPAASLLAGLQASEKRHPAGKAWASVWRGPGHVFFGHDAGRRLQVQPFATGLDGGCVYGGRMYAAVLPPLDEAGHPMTARMEGSLPADAEQLTLGTGLVAHLVSVPAGKVHSPPKAKQLPQPEPQL